MNAEAPTNGNPANGSPASGPDGPVARGDAILSVQGLRAGYGDIPVLRGVSMDLTENEVLGLLGHNGMGKSTLLKTLMGLLPATGGQITFEGTPITRLPTWRRSRLGFGYVPQGRGIFPNLTVRENLHFAWSEETGDASAEAGIDRIVADFPRLAPLLDRQGGVLSGGEQQILAVARCLIADPVLFLLDEPTEGIQPSIIEEMAETLVSIRQSRGLTLLLVEQNLEFLTQLSDRILVLERGAVKAEIARDSFGATGLIEEFAGLGGGSARTAAAPAPAPAAIPAGVAAAPLARPQPQVHLRTPAPKPPPRPPETPPPPPAQPIGNAMTVRRPTLDQMRDIVRSFGMSMSDGEIESFLDLMEPTLAAYDRVDALRDAPPTVKYPRTPGTRPGDSENPMNAWYIKCEIRGAPGGRLDGKTVALKDNVCLAGVPMMNGASTLEGYTPDLDATIVTRMLDEGATIAGKAHCEYFCLSGGSHTNASAPVHNPWKIGHTAGGSSSGSGALVGAGEVDMAIGGDQGGSIRIPASFSGCYGMKPTHGLVPYTGVMPIEPTIDHTGPMTGNVADNALLLEVIAGADGLDPRQYKPRVDDYTKAIGRGAGGMRIGVVQEGFGLDNSEPGVDAKVRAAAERFRAMGATVEDVSISMHSDGLAIWTPVALEGATNTMMKGNGFGTSWKGLYVTSLLDAHANWRARADELSHSLKITMMIGEYMLKHHRGHYFAKSQNLARQLTAAYDDVLGRYDLLLMPTLPMVAPPIPGPDAPLSLYIQRAFEMIPNTAPFDITGHPSMSIPCGLSDGLPVGLMLTGKHYDESAIYRAAHAFEQDEDWRTL
ncbi:MAG: amidase [Rhodospirillaceae bacterium]|nr:amidase [Rhodospirillaceae bacterium]MDE0619275.1 amidase [Rhodospirillaceae bacterium]